MFKRTALVIATNLAVLALVGINPGSWGGLLVFAVLFGFGGWLVSMPASKWVAKRFDGATLIESPHIEAEQ